MAIEKKVTSFGQVRYRVDIWHKGIKIKSSSFNKEADATAWEVQQYAEMERDSAFPDRPKNKTFDDVYNEWLTMHAEHNKAKGSVERDKQIYRSYLQSFVGKKKLSDIKSADFDKLKTALIKSGSLKPASINRILELPRTVLNYAVKKDYILKSPMLAVKFMTISEQSFDYWEEHEASKFLSHSKRKYSENNQWVYVFYLLCLKTGVRLGEALALMWENINFDKNLIRINATIDRIAKQVKMTTKSKRIRYVGMDSELKVNLMALRNKSTSKFVFPNKKGNFNNHENIRKRYFEKDTREAEVRKIRIHDMRHTFASHFVMNGGDLFVLQKLLGHSDIKITMRYAHLAPNYLADKTNIVTYNSDLYNDDEKANRNVIEMTSALSHPKSTPLLHPQEQKKGLDPIGLNPLKRCPTATL